MFSGVDAERTDREKKKGVYFLIKGLGTWQFIRVSDTNLQLLIS